MSPAFEGEHFTLEQPMNHPLPVRRPPLLIGGGGERKTLRLVARYADAINLFEPQVEAKVEVLRRHCAEVGRPYEEIVVTTTGLLGPTDSVDAAVERFGMLADVGVDLALVDATIPFQPAAEFLSEVIPQVREVGRPTPPQLRHP